jgi:signal transduction histidine kinase
MTSWARPLGATLVAAGVVLATSWAATQVGKAIEGHAPSSAMSFDKLESNLVAVTLVALPLLFVALWLRVLERIRRIRLKLFTACLVGQAAALAAVVVAANNRHAMPFDPPSDGLFAVLLVYAATLSLALSYLLAGSITRALTRIRAGAARIADGDLETRVVVDTHDELADLAADLNALAVRLDAAARQERRMEQSRRDLIAAVSHDLRTPLAAIRATIEAITDGVVTDEATITRYLCTMHDSTRELSRLIDDLFDLSRLDAGALVLELEPAALADLVSDTLERMRPQAAARDVVLTGFAAADLPLVPLDARFVGRVLANLVDNAVRHTPAGGRVEVAVYREGPAVRVEVRDTGEGIAPADLPHVFERFYRGEKSRSREHGGAGLGLAICKGIVEAHGGRIWAEARSPQGTQVSFTLPIATPALTR